MNLRSEFDDEALRIGELDDERRREILSAYLDDELAPAAAGHVTAWLDEHPEALREVERDRRVWDLLELYEDEPIPDGFAARVLRHLGLTSRLADGRHVLQLRPAVLAAAAVLLVALGAFLFWSVGGTEAAPTDASDRDVVAGLDIPVEYLEEEVDVLLALDDEGFQAYLVQDLEDLEAQGEDG